MQGFGYRSQQYGEWELAGDVAGRWENIMFELKLPTTFCMMKHHEGLTHINSESDFHDAPSIISFELSK